MAYWRDSGQFAGRAWVQPFGFRRGLQDPVTGGFPTPEEIIATGQDHVDTVPHAMEVSERRQPVDGPSLRPERPGAA